VQITTSMNPDCERLSLIPYKHSNNNNSCEMTLRRNQHALSTVIVMNLLTTNQAIGVHKMTITRQTASSNEFAVAPRISVCTVTLVASLAVRRLTRSAIATWSILTRRTVDDSDEFQWIGSKFQLSAVDYNSAYATYNSGETSATCP